jgi:hypothetical protein
LDLKSKVSIKETINKYVGMINKYGDTPKTPFSNTFGKELVNKAKILSQNKNA